MILSAILTCSSSLFAQNNAEAPRSSFSRNSFWTETVINGRITDKWKWQLDYQYRRQSDASDVKDASKNPFQNKFQHVYRPWVHYQMNENIRFSLSPIGFWESFTPPGEAGGVTKIQPELRICPQITLTNKIGRVIIDQRYRYEYRLLGKKVNEEAGNEFGYHQGANFDGAFSKNRARYFLRATVPLGKHTKLENNTFYITTWNELFVAFGKNTNSDKIWDQNRTFCMLGYKPNMDFPMRFELGYGLQYANRISSSLDQTSVPGTTLTKETGNKIEHNNILQVYVIFENFNELFKSKKKKTN